MSQTDGQLIEVFSSIQGEGLLIGWRQIFVRLALCNLACRYCDTPVDPQESCRVETAPGAGSFFGLPNPVSLDVLSSLVADWVGRLPGGHHSISITGGEPLMQDRVLQSWLPALRSLLPIHLETNGTLPEAFAPLVSHVDWVSMDIKLASQTGEPTPWSTHEDFLALAAGHHCCVKVVVGMETTVEEVQQAAEIMRRKAPSAPLILQPITRAGQVGTAAAHLFRLQERAASIHGLVRVIPQTHAFLGLL
jgi:organic radical activating enzyme